MNVIERLVSKAELNLNKLRFLICHEAIVFDSVLM
jgi:hypothetical protein